jgi:hypothetical protein
MAFTSCVHALEEPAHHRPQRHRLHRFVQQLVPALLRLAQPLGRSVTAHHKGWDHPVDLAKFRNCCDAGLLVSEMIIRNDEIGARARADIAHSRHGSFGRHRDNHTAAPIAQQPANAFQHPSIVVDHHHQFTPGNVGGGLGRRLDLELRGYPRRRRGHGHAKARALAERRGQFDWMIKEGAEAIDDG